MSRNNLPAAAGGAGEAPGGAAKVTAEQKIKEFQDYLTTNELLLDTTTTGIFTTLTIKKGVVPIAYIKYTDYDEPPATHFHGDMDVFTKPTIYVDQITRLSDEYKGIGKLLLQYVAAIAATKSKTLGFTAFSGTGNTEKLVRYYNSIGANKVVKRFDKKPWGFLERQLARSGVVYKTNDPLKIVSSGGGKTRKGQRYRKRKQTRRF